MVKNLELAEHFKSVIIQYIEEKLENMYEKMLGFNKHLYLYVNIEIII